MVLTNNTGIKKYAIKLVEGKKSLYSFIYTANMKKLETLKAHIKTQLKTGFILLSKSFISTFISFNKKRNDSFHLCINY